MEKKEEKILTGYKIRKDLSINLEIGKPLKNLNKSQFFFLHSSELHVYNDYITEKFKSIRISHYFIYFF